MIYMKYEALFPSKIKKDTTFFVCCNCEWGLSGYFLRTFTVPFWAVFLTGMIIHDKNKLVE